MHMEYKFGDIALNSTLKKKPEDNDRFHYIGLEHLDSGSLFVQRYGADTAPVGEKLIIKKGDVLFGKRRAYQKKVAIAPFDGIFSAHGMVLRPNETIINKNYFPFFIRSDRFLNEAIRISVGSLSPTINWRDLKELRFELPPIEEQERLATLLWAAYDLKESYKNLITATDEMVKSQFIEMFGNVSRYPLSKIEDLCETFIDGNWIESKDQSNNGIRLIQTGNISNGYYVDKLDRARYISEDTFDRLNCTEVGPGDILISRLPDPIGRACIIPSGLGKAITAVDCSIVKLKTICLPEYFIAFTHTSWYESQVATYTAGSTRQRISRKNLGTIEMPCPPIKEQTAFVKVLRQAEKSKAELQQSIDNIDKVMKSLLP